MKSAVEATKSAAAATTDAMKNAMEATKNAAAAIVRLPNTRVVEVHERLRRGGERRAGLRRRGDDRLPQQGFRGGKPLDVRTAENAMPQHRRCMPGQCLGRANARSKRSSSAPSASNDSA